MPINFFAILLFTLLPIISFAADGIHGMSHNEMAAEHGGDIFHMFRAEADTGANNKGETVFSWDIKGWVGTDENKLYLKTEGENKDGTQEATEIWGLYSRNIATFWDFQAGIRYDAKPYSTTYFTLGFAGLAPYSFETEAHFFISDKGAASLRIREENDLLITQKLIAQPYAEINIFAQDIKEQDIGAGLCDGKFGLQTRYELMKKFAPYIDFHYGRKFGETAYIARKYGEDIDEFVSALGIRLMF